MSDKRDINGHPDNVVPFPAPMRPVAGKEEPKISVVASASFADATRRKETARLVEPKLAIKKAMEFSERVVMARNARDYVYGLEAANRLVVHQIGGALYGREEVRALQQYVLPQGIDTEEEFKVRHPTRVLAGKPAKYLAVVQAAAKIAGDDPDNALLALAKGTRFWPGAEQAADDERRAANEVVELLARLPAHLDRLYPLERYFDLIERQQVLPIERDAGLVFDGVDEFGWWEHEAIPCVRMATRWLPPRTVPVVVAVSEIGVTDERVRVDFDAVHSAKRSFGAWVSRRQIFSLGIGRISGIVGPVAIFSHEVVLPNGKDYEVTDRASVDRLGPGWNRCSVDLGTGPLRAAWQLEEALLDRSDEEEQEYDEPPDVRMERVTADWLLERTEGDWLIPKTTGFTAGMWHVLAQMGRGRISAPDTLPSIIERCLLAESSKEGPVTEITRRYGAFVDALKEWRAVVDARAQKRLGQVAARLAGQPDPDEDRLSHLD